MPDPIPRTVPETGGFLTFFQNSPAIRSAVLGKLGGATVSAAAATACVLLYRRSIESNILWDIQGTVFVAFFVLPWLFSIASTLWQGFRAHKRETTQRKPLPIAMRTRC